jgi:hypothetical protein
MSKGTDKDAKKASADLVLQEVWRAKDAPCAPATPNSAARFQNWM